MNTCLVCNIRPALLCKACGWKMCIICSGKRENSAMVIHKKESPNCKEGRYRVTKYGTICEDNWPSFEVVV